MKICQDNRILIKIGKIYVKTDVRTVIPRLTSDTANEFFG